VKTRAIALPALPPNGPASKLQLAIDHLLSSDLEAYRRAYTETHGQDISLEHLVPAILRLFLARDRGFQKWKKEQAAGVEPTTLSTHAGNWRGGGVPESTREPASARYAVPSGDAGLGEGPQNHDPA
jgi:hypothetical protein